MNPHAGLLRFGKHPSRVHLDAGKCIQCGLCVQVAEDAGEEIGLSFEGRGFYTAIVSPLGYSLDEALTKAGVDAAAVCPTGALSVISEEPETSKNPIDLFEQKYLKT